MIKRERNKGKIEEIFGARKGVQKCAKTRTEIGFSFLRTRVSRPQTPAEKSLIRFFADFLNLKTAGVDPFLIIFQKSNLIQKMTALFKHQSAKGQNRRSILPFLAPFLSVLTRT